MGETKNLEDLSKEDCFVLFDTTIIMHPLGKRRGDFIDIKDKIDFTKENIRFLVETRQYIEKGSNFYITEPVRKEIRDGDFYSKCHLEKIIKKEGGCRNKELLKLRRLIVEKKEEKGRLIESFRNKNKIITFNGSEKEKELYDCLFEKYREIGKDHGLTYADFDLLMKGLTIAIASNPVDLLSNDYHIFYARNDILQKINSQERKIFNKDIGDKDLGFFNRIDFFDFKSLVMRFY